MSKTWACSKDLYSRYGQEFVDKLARRRDFDKEANDGDGAYVENEKNCRVDEVLKLALCDAQEWILWKLSCCYNITDIKTLLEAGEEFSFLKRYHIKLTITMLKYGGDCAECDDCKAEISELCNCSQIYTDSGIPVVSKSRSKFAVEATTPSCLPTKVCCGCNSHRCDCGK